MRRLFTINQAQELIPWLTEILNDARPAREAMVSLNQEAEDLDGRMRSNGGIRANERLATVRRSYEEASGAVAQRVHLITARGVIVKDAVRGLVDFPSLREKREVYLCWIEGESEIGFWHEVDAGFAGRQSL